MKGNLINESLDVTNLSNLTHHINDTNNKTTNLFIFDIHFYLQIFLYLLIYLIFCKRFTLLSLVYRSAKISIPTAFSTLPRIEASPAPVAPEGPGTGLSILCGTGGQPGGGGGPGGH